jgi:aminoglycoside/choline kinase family phosphotransferase
MTGPFAYDIANLVEDARVTVPAARRDAMLARYMASMSAPEKEIFLVWYRVLATQFHCRVIGQFIRLAVRDGKSRYLQFIPRVADYLRAGLDDPVLAPLRAWFDSHKISFDAALHIEPEDIRHYIRPDAF